MMETAVLVIAVLAAILAMASGVWVAWVLIGAISHAERPAIPDSDPAPTPEPKSSHHEDSRS